MDTASQSPDASTSPEPQRRTLHGGAGELEAWLVEPTSDTDRRHPGLILAPGFPTDPGGGANSFKTFPDLAVRIADEARMTVLALAYRGVASSSGHFSLQGWKRDLHTALDQLRRVDDVSTIWMMGFGTGGALSIAAAADDRRVAGVVSVAAPADFTDWGGRPRELLSHARRCGAISDPDQPADFGRWSKELLQVAAVGSAGELGDTRLLVLHGSDDDAVPALDARAIADAHGSADLRIIDRARHHLRHDPRAMAIAIGWLHRRGLPAQQIGDSPVMTTS